MLTAGGEQVNRDQWRLDETAQPSKGSGRGLDARAAGGARFPADGFSARCPETPAQVAWTVWTVVYFDVYMRSIVSTPAVRNHIAGVVTQYGDWQGLIPCLPGS